MRENHFDIHLPTRTPTFLLPTEISFTTKSSSDKCLPTRTPTCRLLRSRPWPWPLQQLWLPCELGSGMEDFPRLQFLRKQVPLSRGLRMRPCQ